MSPSVPTVPQMPPHYPRVGTTRTSPPRGHPTGHPPHPAGDTGPPRQPHSSPHSGGARVPRDLGGRRWPWWGPPSVSPVGPPQGGPPPSRASPAASVNQPWPRSRVLVKMEAPELLRVWVLAGEWEPCHPPPREGTRPGQGYPQRGGNGGDPQRGVWMGVAGGKGQWRGGKCGCDVTGLNKAVLSLVPAGFGTGDTEWHLSMMGPGQGKVLSPSRSLSPFPLPPKYSPPCCPGTPGTTGTRFCPSPVSQGGGGGGGLWAPAGHPGVSGEWGN